MPWETLKVAPSVDIEKTPSDNMSGITESSFIRWRENLPEKRGGWAKFNNLTLSGVPRALHAWQGLNKDKRLAIGTTTNLYVDFLGSTKDITPQTTISQPAVALSTAIGSREVTITDIGRNATIYDAVIIETPVSVGGITLYGAYQVTASVGPNQYKVTAPMAATGTVGSGGAVATFTTTAGIVQVTVTLAAHTYAVGDYAAFPISTSGNGVTISGQYLVTSVPTPDTFTINATQQATGAGTFPMNAGNLYLVYYITQGPTILGTGWGVGGWGSGGWGTGVAAPASVGTQITATDWWLSNWGETLIASVTDGPIFTWSTGTGLNNGQLIAEAPVACAGTLVAMPQMQLFTWGSTYNGVQDPLQIRWSDVENFSLWTPQAINQAGGFHIPTGSQIVRGIQGPNQIYWFTDIDLYVSQYVGSTTTVWGFNLIAEKCGLIAPKAVVALNNKMYWMSQKQFYVVSGTGVEPLPCSVWDFVFQNLNTAYVANIRAVSNTQFNEVIWFFPSVLSQSGENDSYVAFNALYNEWDYGSINRSAWIDQSILGGPIGADSNGVIYQHEISNDADGSAITSFFKTGYYTMSNGRDMIIVDRMIPDAKWGQYSQSKNATLQVSFNVRDYPEDTPRLVGPFTVTSATKFIEPRLRGRYIQIVVESSDVGSFWRLGSFRYRYAPDGSR